MWVLIRVRKMVLLIVEPYRNLLEKMFPNHSCHSFITLLSLFAIIINAQFNQQTTTDLAGNPVWTPQPIANPLAVVPVQRVPPAAQPTLVWNCEQMQSICTNAYNWLLNNGFNGVIPTPFELVFDTDSGRKTSRQRAMCKTNVWNGHACPDTGLTVKNNLYAPLPPAVINPSFYPNIGGNQPGDLWIIPGPNGGQSPSGLKYTCDEYVPS